MAVAIQIVAGLCRRWRCVIEQRFQRQQVVPYGAPQMWQVEATEQAVPIGVVGLGAVQVFLHCRRALILW